MLGPLLFLLFINDLPDCVESKTRQFADDCIIYRNVKTIKDCQELQNDLFKLTDWEQKWGMLFHPDKCNSMQVTRSRNPLMFKNSLKVSKVAKIRNRYNQVPHLTQDTNGKVTNSQKTPQTRAKRSALSQQVTTKHI